MATPSERSLSNSLLSRLRQLTQDYNPQDASPFYRLPLELRDATLEMLFSPEEVPCILPHESECVDAKALESLSQPGYPKLFFCGCTGFSKEKYFNPAMKTEQAMLLTCRRAGVESRSLAKFNRYSQVFTFPDQSTITTMPDSSRFTGSMIEYAVFTQSGRNMLQIMDKACRTRI
jgi:hypothetical protein